MLAIALLLVCTTTNTLAEEAMLLERIVQSRHPHCPALTVDVFDHYFPQFFCEEVDLWRVPYSECSDSAGAVTPGYLFFAIGQEETVRELGPGDIPCSCAISASPSDTKNADMLARFHLRYYEALDADDWYIYSSPDQWTSHNKQINKYRMRSATECPETALDLKHLIAELPESTFGDWAVDAGGRINRDYLAWNAVTGSLFRYSLAITHSLKVVTIEREKLASAVGCFGKLRSSSMLALLSANVSEDYLLPADSCHLVWRMDQPESFPNLVRFWEIHPCVIEHPSSSGIPTRIFATVADSIAYPISGLGVSRFRDLVESLGLRIAREMLTCYAQFLVELHKTFEDDIVYSFKTGPDLVEFNRNLCEQRFGNYGYLEAEQALDSIMTLTAKANAMREGLFPATDSNLVALYMWDHSRGELRYVVYSITEDGQYELLHDVILSPNIGCMLDK
jgi:hypothetical protein